MTALIWAGYVLGFLAAWTAVSLPVASLVGMALARSAVHCPAPDDTRTT